MFHQPSPRFHQPLLQAGQRSVLDALGQRQPPPQIAQKPSSDQNLCQCWNLIAQAALRFSVTTSGSLLPPLSTNGFDQIFQCIPVAFPSLFSVYLEELLQALQQEH